MSKQKTSSQRTKTFFPQPPNVIFSSTKTRPIRSELCQYLIPQKKTCSPSDVRTKGLRCSATAVPRFETYRGGLMFKTRTRKPGVIFLYIGGASCTIPLFLIKRPVPEAYVDWSVFAGNRTVAIYVLGRILNIQRRVFVLLNT